SVVDITHPTNPFNPFNPLLNFTSRQSVLARLVQQRLLHPLKIVSVQSVVKNLVGCVESTTD
uniref:hypothetical protein n=1 Tax=Prevotella sp. TaxID=59823 RepID=UPI004026597F